MAKNAQIIKKQQEAIIKEIANMVTIMGVEAKNHYVKSFKNQGFTDDNLVKWKPRKGEIVGGIAKLSRREKGSRAILIGSRSKGSQHLWQSIRVVSKGQFSVTLGSDLIYAQVHNDGLRAGRGKGFTMPKRQFIGASRVLSNRLMQRFDKRIQRIFK